MEFDFDRGSGLTIRLNGTIAGGIYMLKKFIKRETEYIYEFLTDKPVGKTVSERYVLELEMRQQNEACAGIEIETVEITDKNTREVFTGCTVVKDEAAAAGSGFIERRLEIIAAERSVFDERDTERTC